MPYLCPTIWKDLCPACALLFKNSCALLVPYYLKRLVPYLCPNFLKDLCPTCAQLFEKTCVLLLHRRYVTCQPGLQEKVICQCQLWDKTLTGNYLVSRAIGSGEVASSGAISWYSPSVKSPQKAIIAGKHCQIRQLHVNPPLGRDVSSGTGVSLDLR